MSSSTIMLKKFERSINKLTQLFRMGNVSSANHNLRENSCKPRQKSRLNSPKKITHVDDMMIHNLVKYLVQTRLRLWDIKTTNFKLRSCPYDLLEICYFYISQTKSNLDKIFYNVVYHRIIYMCDFFGWI